VAQLSGVPVRSTQELSPSDDRPADATRTTVEVDEVRHTPACAVVTLGQCSELRIVRDVDRQRGDVGERPAQGFLTPLKVRGVADQTVKSAYEAGYGDTDAAYTKSRLLCAHRSHDGAREMHHLRHRRNPVEFVSHLAPHLGVQSHDRHGERVNLGMYGERSHRGAQRHPMARPTDRTVGDRLVLVDQAQSG
jgi:hypothetical protein